MLIIQTAEDILRGARQSDDMDAYVVDSLSDLAAEDGVWFAERVSRAIASLMLGLYRQN